MPRSEQLEVARALFQAVAENDLEQTSGADRSRCRVAILLCVGRRGWRVPRALGTRRYIADLRDAWAVVRPEIDAAIEAGEVLLTVGRIRYEGRGSGAGTEDTAGWMFKFRSGKIAVFRAFTDPEQAFEAVGLAR